MNNQEAASILKILASGIELKVDTEPWAQSVFYESYEMAIKALENDRPTGEWIKDDEVHSKCSLCGFKYADYRILFDYCPNCGADMRGNTKRKGTPIEGNNESYNCENWIP